MMLKTKPENKNHINHYRTFFEDNVRQHLERVKGVGSLFVFGGTENELHVDLDMQKMAQYNVTINQISGAVTQANTTVSAGVLGIGRKNYRVRTISQFQTPEDALDVVIFDDGLKRVYLRRYCQRSQGLQERDRRRAPQRRADYRDRCPQGTGRQRAGHDRSGRTGGRTPE